MKAKDPDISSHHKIVSMFKLSRDAYMMGQSSVSYVVQEKFKSDLFAFKNKSQRKDETIDDLKRRLEALNREGVSIGMDPLSDEEKAHAFIDALSHIFLSLKLELANKEGRMRLIDVSSQAGRDFVALNGFPNNLDMAVGLAEVHMVTVPIKNEDGLYEMVSNFATQLTYDDAEPKDAEPKESKGGGGKRKGKKGEEGKKGEGKIPKPSRACSLCSEDHFDNQCPLIKQIIKDKKESLAVEKAEKERKAKADAETQRILAAFTPEDWVSDDED